MLAYFLGQVGNTIPIPGAVSGGLVGALLAFGVDADLAIVSVLAYRAIAIWLPAPIGLVALSALRAHDRRVGPRGRAAAAPRPVEVARARRDRAPVPGAAARPGGPAKHPPRRGMTARGPPALLIALAAVAAGAVRR